MPKLVTYRCPECHGEFDFLHHPSDEPPPDRCQIPECGKWMGDDPEKAPVLYLKIGSAKNKIPDQVYRKMEKASAERAEDAAAMVGASAGEMGAVKITDMKDNQRAGDIAAKTIVEPAAAMKNLSNNTGSPAYQGMSQQQATAWADTTRSGPAALATRSVINDLQSSGRHNTTLATATARGSDGKRY